MGNREQSSAMETLRVRIRSIFDKRSTELSKYWEGYSRTRQLDTQIVAELHDGLGVRYTELHKAASEEEVQKLLTEFMTWTSMLSNKMDQKMDPGYFRKEEENRRKLALLKDAPEDEAQRLLLLKETHDAFFTHQTDLTIMGLRGFALSEEIYQEAVKRLEENRERCHGQLMDAATTKEAIQTMFSFTSGETEIRKWATTDAVKTARRRAKPYVTVAQGNVFAMTLDS